MQDTGIMKKLNAIGTNNAPIFVGVLHEKIQEMRVVGHNFDYPSFSEEGRNALPKGVSSSPQKVAESFAKTKAELLIGDTPELVISFHSIGILKMGDAEEEIPNPKNWDETEAMLKRLSGRSFEYYIAIAYGVPKESGGHEYRVETCSVTLSVQKIADDDIEAPRKKMDGVSNAHAFGRLGFGYRPLTWPGICEFIEDLEKKKEDLASELERVLKLLFPETTKRNKSQ